MIVVIVIQSLRHYANSQTRTSSSSAVQPVANVAKSVSMIEQDVDELQNTALIY